METSELLGAALAKAGTKDQVATVAGVTRRQVSRWYGGEAEPMGPAVAALLRYIGKGEREVQRVVSERSLAGVGYRSRASSPVRVEPRAATGGR